MAGTRTVEIRETLRMPPSTAKRASTVTTVPVSRGEMWKTLSRAWAMEWDWVMLPMPKEARTVERAKRKASKPPSHRGETALRMVYMGPPDHSPRALTSRYLTASMHSANLELRPKAAESSIHTRAPGPPAVRAVATPTMFPVPMVAASAVIRAEKGDTDPAPPERTRD